MGLNETYPRRRKGWLVSSFCYFYLPHVFCCKASLPMKPGCLQICLPIGQLSASIVRNPRNGEQTVTLFDGQTSPVINIPNRHQKKETVTHCSVSVACRAWYYCAQLDFWFRLDPTCALNNPHFPSETKSCATLTVFKLMRSSQCCARILRLPEPIYSQNR